MKKQQTNRQQKPAKTLIRDLEINSIRAMEGEGNERTFILSFSSEEPYNRSFGAEILDHSEGCIDLTRLSEIGCVLFNHDRDKVIGKVKNVWIEDSRGLAEIEMDTDEKSEVIFQKMTSGTLKGVSVGYIVNVWEDVLIGQTSIDGRFKGPCYVAKKWEPFEISIVSVPADPSVGVGREMEKDAEIEVTEEPATEPDTEEIEKSGRSLLNAALRQLSINKNKFQKEEKRNDKK